MGRPKKPVRSILVYVGLDRVGDGLLKLPFVRGLREAFPDAVITWVAGKETSVYASVLAPLVDGVLDEVVEHAGIGFSAKELIQPKPLGGRRFDLVIDTQRIFWTSLVLWRVPHTTFVSPAARFLLSSVKPPKGYRFPKSMQRQLLDLLELASGRTFATPDGLKLPMNPAFDALAAELLPDGPTYVGLAPGSGGRPKCWPLDNFIAVARVQVEKGRIPVVVLGPQELDWQDGIAAKVPEALFPLQAGGVAEKTGWDPLFTIALSKRFAAAVSNDSGTGHMFAVGGRPLTCLYGTTVPEKFLPMTPALTIIRAATFGDRDIKNIPVEAVVQAVDDALSGG